MGQHRQSQGNESKNRGEPQGGSQQNVDRDSASSQTTGNPQQQQHQEGGRSQQGDSDGTAPRSGTRRDPENPSESANQQDSHGGESGNKR
jgi:hypothetical protein